MFGLKALVGQKTKQSPLKTEIYNLQVKVQKDEKALIKAERNFWKNGGTCCPSCGVSGFSELSTLQDQRRIRIDQLLAKLKRDTQSKEKTDEPPAKVEELYNPEELYPPI